MIFAPEPYILHLLAGSTTILSLDAVKALLDNGSHNVNEREAEDNFSALHIAAAWDNLAMCQLLVHYGADLDAVDIDHRKPIDVASGRSRKFLKKFCRKKRNDRRRLAKIFSFLFGRNCLEPKNVNSSILSPYQRADMKRNSCPPMLPEIPQRSTSLGTAFQHQFNNYSTCLNFSEADENITKGFTDGYETAATSFMGRKLSKNSTTLMEDVNSNKKSSGQDEDFGKEIYSELHPNVTVRSKQKTSILNKTGDQEYLSSDNSTPCTSSNMLAIENTSKCQNDLTKTFVGFESMNSYHTSLYPCLKSIKTKPSFNFKEIVSSTREKIDLSNQFVNSKSENGDCNSLNNLTKRLEKIKMSKCEDGFSSKLVDTNPVEVVETKNQQVEINNIEMDFCQEMSCLHIDVLKQKLKERKCSIGPINESNRRLYERKLVKLEINLQSGKDFSLNKYSLALQQVLNDEVNQTTSTQLNGESEEREIRQKFSQLNLKDDVSFFCYFLIDPTQLPSQVETCSLREFVSSIFYIGKGKRSRPLQHLFDASQCRALAQQKKSIKITDKLQRILNLWDCNDGVISLHISHNIYSEEAYIREGCMIDAIGLENLTNIRRGKCLPKWTKKQVTEYGALLIRKAHIVFCNERCRPVFEKDVAGMSQQFNYFVQRNRGNGDVR